MAGCFLVNSKWRADPRNLESLVSADLPNRCLLHAALREPARARIVIDDQDQPNQCLIRTGFNGWTFFAGDSADFLAEAVELLRSVLPVVLIWPNDAIGPPPSGFETWTERLEFMDRTAALHPPALPEGGTIEPTTPTLLERCKWRDEYAEPTPNPPAAFGADYSGLCLVLRGSQILCETYAPWWKDELCEIGVVTPEEHRGHGYATIAASHLAARIESVGVNTTWTCHATNAASVATARALGYQTERPYRLVRYSSTHLRSEGPPDVPTSHRG